MSALPDQTPMMAVDGLRVIYQDSILALDGVSFEARPQQVTAILGSNGAGKSTLLRAVSGTLGTRGGRIQAGTIQYESKVAPESPSAIVTSGIRLVPENRGVFAELTVNENLLVGAHTLRDRTQIREGIDLAFTYFPRLAERSTGRAGLLSGGEQQMLAIGMALISRPRLLLLDEPSLGLAPLVVQQIFEVIARLVSQEDVTIILVEQSVGSALELADYGYVLQNGKVAMHNTSEKLRAHPAIQHSYLGTAHRSAS